MVWSHLSEDFRLARYTDSVCRLCRRESVKLFLKGDRCYTEKCAIERRPYIPGVHGQRRQKLSDYAIQLREKQKVKRIYGLMEKQFRKTFHRAANMKGVTGEQLLQLLERRLDNVVYRLGFAGSHAEARQLIRHRHIHVNGRAVDIASFETSEGDEVSVREKSRKVSRISESMVSLERRGLPGWLELDKGTFSGKVSRLPARDDVTMPINEQLVVELYSK